MDDKKLWKNNLENFFQTAKSKVTNKIHSLNLHSEVSSNKYDTISTLSACSLLSVSQKPNFEGITLIWYDPLIGKSEDTKITLKELREINDCVIQYSNEIDCIKYMQSVENEKIFLITSGKAAISIMPEIQQMRQIDSIFIFCLKVEKYQHLLQKYDTIVGIYCERSTLINSIKESVDLLRRQLEAFSFYNEHEEKSTRDISEESAEFLWFQLFKDVLLQMPRNNQAKQELVDFSRQYYRGNQKEYKNIIEFERSYQLDKSIYWYTKDSFLYRLVNKALRTEDVGQLHLFRFFISDLSTKLAEIHAKKNHGKKDIITLYRGFKMEINELKRLKQNVGCIISANGFLSTSHSKDIAIRFGTQSTKRTNIVSVLYEIECNLNTSGSVIFADITKYSEYAQEQEVLFDLGSTFKIESINENEQLKMVLVKLIATDTGMKMAQQYIELNRKTNEETTPDILFGVLLVKMGKYDQSLSYFRNLLNISKENIDIARVYSAIGSAYICKGKLDEAYENADRAYRMMIKAKPSRIKDSTKPMTTMAHVYLRREMYEKSLDFYFEILEIREKFYGRNHLDTAVTLNDIGNVYYKMQDYSKSLMYYNKSFEIRQNQLPPVHLDVAASLNNLGLIYWKMDDKYGAQCYYEQSLNIRKQLLPIEHNDIIQSLHNLTQVLYEANEIDESLRYFVEALTIQKVDFDPSDRDNLLSRLKEKFGPRIDNLKLPLRTPAAWPAYAFQVIRECVNFETQDCSSNGKREHFRILENFIEILDNGDDYSTALEAATSILMASKSVTSGYDYNEHLMAHLYDLVVHRYDSTDESIKARHFYEKVQFILERVISRWVNTSDIQVICFDRIGYIHQLNNNYELALKSLEKSVTIQRDNKKTSADFHDKLSNIGLIHMTLGNYKSALLTFNDALQLLQSNSVAKEREIKLLLKRIDQVKEELK